MALLGSLCLVGDYLRRGQGSSNIFLFFFVGGGGSEHHLLKSFQVLEWEDFPLWGPVPMEENTMGRIK